MKASTSVNPCICSVRARVEARRKPQTALDVTHREAGTAWRMSQKSGAAARHPKMKKAGTHPAFPHAASSALSTSTSAMPWRIRAGVGPPASHASPSW
ncbi:hypothetical protein MB99_20935 [Salmonella enterica subsp. enterica serovar Agona]|nr:hypothetical protein [Salmonella enterica subsp. enterica serovar Agona]ECM4294521.1 hypothetical protein [Salmonella enterica subsp. enterica serovar Montevideo]EED3651566.1 hypothetical protein [Salmonella enterica subsp. enterica serovar Agona]